MKSFTEILRSDIDKFYSKSNNEQIYKIIGYKYKIEIKKDEYLEGILSREQMETIYSLYSYYGSCLTQREVAREFPQYKLQDFKRILRAFKITKQSSNFPPHFFEEYTSEELLELNISLQESIYLKKKEQQINRDNAKIITNLLKENSELKDILKRGEEISKHINKNSEEYKITYNNSGSKHLALYLSDMHIGCNVPSDSLYDNTYNLDEVQRRLSIIFNKIISIKDLDSITIFNLGDAIDGINNSTTRPEHSHYLPQNMTDVEMISGYINTINEFFDNIIHYYAGSVFLRFISVSQSNHGGSTEYSANLALQAILSQKGVDCEICDKSIGFTKIDNTNIIYFHGKDNYDMFKNFPAVVNDKIELYINEYMIRNNLTGKTLVVKGDLHNSNTTSGRFFDYKSVGSLFGSSKWIQANFGNTPWKTDFSIFENGLRMDGIITE